MHYIINNPSLPEKAADILLKAEQIINNNNSADKNHLLLAIPVNIRIGKFSEIERQLSWSLWGRLFDRYIDSLYQEVNA